MQKKHIITHLIALTLILSHLISISSVQALTASPSSSPTTNESDLGEITENLKKRLQDTLTPSQTPPLNSARAYIGIVKDVIKDTLIIEDKDGKKDVKLDAQTNILRTPGNATIKVDNIRIDDYIIAIGYPQESDILLGKRLIVSVDPIKPPTKNTGLGTLTKITKSSLTLTVNDSELVLATNAKTIYKSTVASIEATDLSVGDTVIFTSLVEGESKQTATTLMRVQTAAIAQ